MRHSLVFLVLTQIAAPSAHAGWFERTKERCHAALVWTGVVTKDAPEFYLTPDDRQRLREVAVFAPLSDAERFAQLKDIWLEARLRHMDALDRNLITRRSPDMPDQRFFGVRADGLLEETAKLVGMETSLIKLVDYVHDVESDIINLEASGQIVDRSNVARDQLNRHYRVSALRAEWEILNALPRTVAHVEIARVKSLRMPAKCRRFAVRLLEDGGLPYANFIKLQNRKFFGHGRIVDWRVHNRPHFRRPKD